MQASVCVVRVMTIVVTGNCCSLWTLSCKVFRLGSAVRVLPLRVCVRILCQDMTLQIIFGMQDLMLRFLLVAVCWEIAGLLMNTKQFVNV